MPLFSIGERRVRLLGRSTLVGANTLIAEGKQIPDGVLVLGSPGKVVRELKEEEKAFLLKIAQGYIDRSRLYRENLKIISEPSG